MSIPPTELERLIKRVSETVPRALATMPVSYWEYAKVRYSGGSFIDLGYITAGRYAWSSSSAGDYVELDFWGSVLGIIFAYKASDRGIAYVYVDGEKVAEIDLYKSAPTQYEVFELIKTDLTDTKHVVRVEVSGLKNDASAGYTIDVVAFCVDPKRNPSFPYGMWLKFLADMRLYMGDMAEQTDQALETTTPLAANAEYVGPALDRKYRTHAYIHAMAFADVDGTIYIDQSHDGSNWDYSESAALTGGAGAKLSSRIVARYVRIRYLNGTTAQTTFRFGKFLTFT